jgi:hypothetical protein
MLHMLFVMMLTTKQRFSSKLRMYYFALAKHIYFCGGPKMAVALRHSIQFVILTVICLVSYNILGTGISL